MKISNVIPCGPEIRKFIGILLAIRGMLYILCFAGPLAVIPYSRSAFVNLPLWVLGVMLLVSGLSLLATLNYRGSNAGRAATVLAVSVCMFMAGGVHENHVQMSTYILLSVMGLREAAVMLNAKGIHGDNVD